MIAEVVAYVMASAVEAEAEEEKTLVSRTEEASAAETEAEE